MIMNASGFADMSMLNNSGFPLSIASNSGKKKTAKQSKLA
jgi:hypothetical protein